MTRAGKMVRAISDITALFASPSCARDCQVPLSQLTRNGRFRVLKLTGDRPLCARIGDLGLYPGAEAELLCPENGSQCVLKVHGCRMSLDHTIASHIIVAST